MDILTLIVGGALAIMVLWFMLRLSYTILTNLINGRKFHHKLEQDFSKLRLNNMLVSLGINKTDYIYQTNAKDIQQQMKSCAECSNTDICDDKLDMSAVDIAEIEFCNNEAALRKLKQKQTEKKEADQQ